MVEILFGILIILCILDMGQSIGRNVRKGLEGMNVHNHINFLIILLNEGKNLLKKK